MPKNTKNWEKEFDELYGELYVDKTGCKMLGGKIPTINKSHMKSFIRKLLTNYVPKEKVVERSRENYKRRKLSMKTNKVKVEIEMTSAQKKDFLKAIADIRGQGAQDDGRAAQLLAATYFS